eukprot:2752985-Karenia_brevis.AAC.1
MSRSGRCVAHPMVAVTTARMYIVHAELAQEAALSYVEYNCHVFGCNGSGASLSWFCCRLFQLRSTVA